MPINTLIIVSVIVLVAVGFFSSTNAKRSLNSDGQDSRQAQISWKKSMKHTVVMYVVPVIILVIPWLSGIKITASDVLQAAAVFLAMSYLKNIYW